MGAVKTAGRGREPEDSPWADQTVTVGRAAIFCTMSTAGGIESVEETHAEMGT